MWSAGTKLLQIIFLAFTIYFTLVKVKNHLFLAFIILFAVVKAKNKCNYSLVERKKFKN